MINLREAGSGSRVAIKASGLSKVFHIYRAPGDLVLEFLGGGIRHEERLALENVDLQLKRGEVVGILGRNGAGKSTLLKIIAGILEKTSGDVAVDGRVTSILELGTGFHPEYTGRENIYMGGLCIGMSRAEVDAKIDEIIDFAELREVIDQPFKTYSTGMQARLTFATVVSVDPDILIIDEALSVGDAKFQRKCFNKFEDFRKAGKSILFVSHDINLINLMCDRAIYLRRGRVRAEGAPMKVCRQYQKDLFGGDEGATNSRSAEDKNGHRKFDFGNKKAQIIECGIKDGRGRELTHLKSNQKATIYARIESRSDDIKDITPGINIKTKEGITVFSINPTIAKKAVPKLKLGDILLVEVDVQMALGIGDYFITFGARSRFEDSHYDKRFDGVHFKVRGDSVLSNSIVNLTPKYKVKVEKL
jgi:ABC-type polysaccharide/polyol phosphate transport system ATPase subunit